MLPPSHCAQGGDPLPQKHVLLRLVVVTEPGGSADESMNWEVLGQRGRGRRGGGCCGSPHSHNNNGVKFC